jgi:hypothetical protein
MNATTVAVDLAKSVFELVAAHTHINSSAGYTTATDSRVDLPTAFLLPCGRSPYKRG